MGQAREAPWSGKRFFAILTVTLLFVCLVGPYVSPVAGAVNTDVYLYLRRSSIMLGESIEYNGNISPSPGVVKVKMQYTLVDQDSWTGEEKDCLADGSFSGSFTPGQAGTYKIVAFWDGNNQYGGGSSAWTQGEIRFTVTYREFTVTFDTDPKGVTVIIDNLEYSGSSLPVSFHWPALSQHQIEAKLETYSGADVRYEFQWWTTSSRPFDTIKPYLEWVKVDSDENIVAHYDKEYRLRLKSDYGSPMWLYRSGSVSYNSSFYMYPEIWCSERSTVYLWIDSDRLIVDHYNGTRRVFSGWTIGGETFGDTSESYTVTGPLTITANWNTECSVRVTSEPNNLLSRVGLEGGSMKQDYYIEGWCIRGQSITVSVSTTSVFDGSFDGWMVDGTLASQSPSYTFVVNRPMIITAKWSFVLPLLIYAATGVVILGVALFFFRRRRAIRAVSPVPPPSSL